MAKITVLPGIVQQFNIPEGGVIPSGTSLPHVAEQGQLFLDTTSNDVFVATTAGTEEQPAIWHGVSESLELEQLAEFVQSVQGQIVDITFQAPVGQSDWLYLIEKINLLENVAAGQFTPAQAFPFRPTNLKAGLIRGNVFVSGTTPKQGVTIEIVDDDGNVVPEGRGTFNQVQPFNFTFPANDNTTYYLQVIANGAVNTAYRAAIHYQGGVKPIT